MALNLKVPELADKPLIIAETRPYKISQFLDSLPMYDSLEAATLLLEEMEILNRQKIGPSQRIKALETYRPTVIDICYMLSRQYSDAHLPLSEVAKTHASLAESLWLEMGYGYKLALIDQQNKLFNLDSNKSSALVLQRIIDSMGKLALVYHHTYVTPPKSLWGELYQLYNYASQESVLDVAVSADDNKKESVDYSFKRVLLMALANPKHLPPNGIDLVAEYISLYGNLSKITPISPIDNSAGYFLVQLNTEQAPVLYAKNSGTLDLANDKLLSVVDLVKLTLKNAKLISSGEGASIKPLSESASDPYYLYLLKDLVKQWGAQGKRLFNRSSKTGGIELGVGVNAAHHFILGLSEPQSDQAEQENESDVAAQLKFRTSRWQYTNISAGGMGLRKYQNVDAKVKVGDIVSVRSNTSSGWSIGILRWANNTDKNLDIGTQLIAPQASAVETRQQNEDAFRPALLLPEFPALNQASSIICNCGTYSPARILELKQPGKISRIMITKLVEKTCSFERFQFSYL